MVFGWFVMGALTLIRGAKRNNVHKVLFVFVAAALSLMLAGLLQEFSSVIIVWFVSALMMLAISSETVKSRLSGSLAAKVLAALFVLALASAIFSAYIAFAWTSQYYDVFMGLQLSAFVVVGISFLNKKEIGDSSVWLSNKRVVNWTTIGAGFSFTLFLTHYPIIIFLNGLNLPIDRLWMFLPILLITNLTALSIAHFTEKRHKALASTIKKRLGLPEC